MTSASAAKTAPVRYPAEWERHSACWLAWPSATDLWQDDLTQAVEEFIGLVKAIVAGDEKVELLVPDERHEAIAATRLAGLLSQQKLRFHRIPYGDIWVRDTGPIFLDAGGVIAARAFRFNGWGGKYELPGDPDVGERIAKAARIPLLRYPFVLEGGALESDGEGTCLTTRQCLLNRNRNGWSQAQAEAALRDALGFRHFVWLDEGLQNDHTDGHIDTLARFVAPGRVVCMAPSGADDPNAAVLRAIERRLATAVDAAGRKLDVVTVPSPGYVANEAGDPMPASYMNFYIANGSVVVPMFGSEHDERAVDALAKLFPNRKVVGLPALAILTGGGAFHCITQQQPSGGLRP
jgi:agmatine deiminase